MAEIEGDMFWHLMAARDLMRDYGKLIFTSPLLGAKAETKLKAWFKAQERIEQNAKAKKKRGRLRVVKGVSHG